MEKHPTFYITSNITPCQIGGSNVFFRFCLFLVAGANLTPVSPLQPESLIVHHRYLWLERGVQERGGFVPSPRLSLENLEFIICLARAIPSLKMA